MTLEKAVEVCRGTGLAGWGLVAFAQHLVNQNMQYSIANSLDIPQVAFEKGQGYCWHQASALNVILLRLGFNSRLVHSYRNLFPEVELAGVIVKDFVSGHVWCRVTMDGVEKDVCPGSANNKPGLLNFKPLGEVHEWSKCMEFLTYYGSALVNFWRRKKYEGIKMKQQIKMKPQEILKQQEKWNPEHCPCKKSSCQRYKKCEECKENHYAKGSLPACER
jgi:hypothetical protein